MMHGMSLTTDTGEWLSRVVTLCDKHDVTEEDVKDIFDCLTVLLQDTLSQQH